MDAGKVVVTGIGLVSSLGEGASAHWDRLGTAGVVPVLESERFAPFLVHPLPEMDWSSQIPKRGDQRQMETWQRLGTYTAGLALDDAGIKTDEALCATMDMVVAAGGGERDEAVDSSILAASLARPDRDVLLNEKLTTELRPTLFLAQLSNLLAGNISIVHKVTGSSRTFMGEEGAGVSAIETATARIRSGQSSHMLVGAAYAAVHPDMMLGYELGSYLHRGPHASVWARAGAPGGGVVSGAGAAFLVLESQQHARKRGARIYAEIASIVSGRSRRVDGVLEDDIAAMAAGLGAGHGDLLVVSGASGAHRATAAERAAFARHPGSVLRAFSTVTGHLREAQFPFAVALAALAAANKTPYPAFDVSAEAAFPTVPGNVLATAVGFHRFEGMALLTGGE